MSHPIDYASPSGKPTGWFFIVVLCAATALLTLFAIGFYMRPRRPTAPTMPTRILPIARVPITPSPTPTLLMLKPNMLTGVLGGRPPLFRLGGMADGQPELTVVDDFNVVLVSKPIKVGDTILFSFSGQQYSITVNTLTDFKGGDDNSSFTLSTIPPPPATKPVAAQAGVGPK